MRGYRHRLQTGAMAAKQEAAEQQGRNVMTSHIPGASDKASELSAMWVMPELTLTAYVLGQARQRASKPALVDAATGAALTYAELAAEVARVSTELMARGMTTGDVLALCAPNSIEFVLTYLAAASAGAVVTTVNPMWTEPEISRQLRQTGARWLVSTADLMAGKLRAPVRETGMAGTFAIGGQAEGEVTPFDELRAGPAAPTAAAWPPAAGGARGGPRPATQLQRHDRTSEDRRPFAPEPGRKPGPDPAGAQGHR